MQDVVWSPSPEYVERANVTRFMRAHGIGTYEELVVRSVGDIAWFWDAVVRDLGISFLTPYEQVLASTSGPTEPPRPSRLSGRPRTARFVASPIGSSAS